MLTPLVSFIMKLFCNFKVSVFLEVCQKLNSINLISLIKVGAGHSGIRENLGGTEKRSEFFDRER